MASLEDVAFLARPVLKGIDWDALAAQGPNEHGIKRNTVFASDYYYQYMRPAGIKAGNVRDTLNLDVSADEAFSHFSSLYDAVKSVTNLAYEAAMQRIPFLSDASSMKMSVSTLRSAVAICWFTALYSAELHRTGALVLSGQMTEEEVVRHASLTTAMFECITLLDGWGVLDPIKKGAPASRPTVSPPTTMPPAPPLSAAPIAAGVVVAIAAVIAIAVVAFMVLSILDVSQKNAMMKKECERARESGDLEMYKTCLEAIKIPNESIATTVFRDAIKSFAPWIVGAGVLLVGVTFAPFFVRQVTKATSEARR